MYVYRQRRTFRTRAQSEATPSLSVLRTLRHWVGHRWWARPSRLGWKRDFLTLREPASWESTPLKSKVEYSQYWPVLGGLQVDFLICVDSGRFRPIAGVKCGLIFTEYGHVTVNMEPHMFTTPFSSNLFVSRVRAQATLQVLGEPRLGSEGRTKILRGIPTRGQAGAARLYLFNIIYSRVSKSSKLPEPLQTWYESIQIGIWAFH